MIQKMKYKKERTKKNYSVVGGRIKINSKLHLSQFVFSGSNQC